MLFFKWITGENVVNGCYEFNYKETVKGVGSGACASDVLCELLQVTLMLHASMCSSLKHLR